MNAFLFAFISPLLFAALPSTANYELNSYGFGSGGTVSSSTATYSLEGTAGELTGSSSGTANATTKPGYVETQQAHVPKLASLDNNSGEYYNKLHFVIDEQGNPSDAKYLVAVSTDNFVSDTKYLPSLIKSSLKPSVTSLISPPKNPHPVSLSAVSPQLICIPSVAIISLSSVKNSSLPSVIKLSTG